VSEAAPPLPQNVTSNIDDVVLEKSAPNPFIEHSAREEANTINTFLGTNFELNTSNMSGNNSAGQGGGVVGYYGQQVRWQLSGTPRLRLIE
jgi:hypothetical protein